MIAPQVTLRTSVSIIIPNYNGNLVLPPLLESIQQQNYAHGDIELIIVDDASTDNSLEIVRSVYPEAIIIGNTKRKGASYAKNRGIEAAHHEWLLFLDNDIVLHTQCISELLREATASCSICFQPKIFFLDTPGVLNSTGGITNMFGYAWDRGIYEHDRGQYDQKRKIFFASTAAMLIKRKTLQTIGMFDADYQYLNEDFDVGYRLHMYGEGVRYVPHAICYHRMSHTMGRNNPTVKYLIERNRVMTVLKNYEKKTICDLFPSLIRITYKKYTTYLSTTMKERISYFFAALCSWFWIVFHLPVIVMKRKRVQRLRSVSDETIIKHMGKYKECFPSFSEWAASNDSDGVIAIPPTAREAIPGLRSPRPSGARDDS